MKTPEDEKKIGNAATVINFLSEYIHGLAFGRSEPATKLLLKNAREAFERFNPSSQIEELTKEAERLKTELETERREGRQEWERLQIEKVDRYREALEAEMSPRVASLLIKVRDEIAKENISEAYHALYQIASPDFDKTEPWEKVEKIAALHPLVKEGE